MLLLANNTTLLALRARLEANVAWRERERATCAFRDSHLPPHLAQAIAHYGTAEAAWRKCLRHRAARARAVRQRERFNTIMTRLAHRALRGEE
jgi:hypothetical protein